MQQVLLPVYLWVGKIMIGNVVEENRDRNTVCVCVQYVIY